LRILVIALPGIGDALLFTPAASLIRQNLPDSEMDALVMFKGAKDIYEQTGLFNKIYYHDFFHTTRVSSLKFVLGLRGKYDVSLNIYPSNRREYNLIQFLIGAGKRGAVKYLRRDFLQAGFLNSVRLTESDLLHNVEENVALCEKLFGFKASEIPDIMLPLTEKEVRDAENFLGSEKIDRENCIVGFHAGGSTLKNHINKRWEPQKFVELGSLLIREPRAKLLIFGGNDEVNVNEEIAKAIGSENVILAKTQSIIQTAALIKRCDLFVTNDSSLMHIASAMKRKVIAVEGPLNLNYTRPWHTDYEIASLFLDCSPCFVYSPRPLICSRIDIKFKCLRELPVEMVYQKTIRLLDKKS